MERVSTGVKGLDEMLNGGLIAGRSYLIKGGPGVGKTALAMHFAMEGVMRGETVLYLTLDEPAGDIRADFGRMGFNVNDPRFVLLDATPALERYGLIEDPSETFAKDLEKLRTAVVERYREIRYSRIVIDPITMLRLNSVKEPEYRRAFLRFVKTMSRLKTTVLITSELKRVDVEEYLVNGIIEMHMFEVQGRLMRGIRITKFRGSGFEPAVRPYEITDRGLVVHHDRVLTLP